MGKADTNQEITLNPIKKEKPQETKPTDNWYTPKWVVDVLKEIGIAPTPEQSVIEPSAGAGSIVESLISMGIRNITVIEKRDIEDLRNIVGPKIDAKIIRGDFLRLHIDEHFDYAILNPPYSLAFEFIQKCVKIADKVVALLGSNFYYSQDRFEFNRDYKPDIYAFAERPAFIKAPEETKKSERKKKGTDMRDRAWYVYPGNNHHELIPPRGRTKRKMKRLTDFGQSEEEET